VESPTSTWKKKQSGINTDWRERTIASNHSSKWTGLTQTVSLATLFLVHRYSATKLTLPQVTFMQSPLDEKTRQFSLTLLNDRREVQCDAPMNVKKVQCSCIAQKSVLVTCTRQSIVVYYLKARQISRPCQAISLKPSSIPSHPQRDFVRIL
jgi:hypothetical protein